jgi:hypothetical protein
VVGISTLLALGAVAGGFPARAAGGLGPDTIGQWTPPFGEGGAAQGDSPKPPAVEAAVLGDGRVFYFQGVERAGSPEGSGPAPLASPAAGRRARVLDLRSGPPRWTAPAGNGDLFCTDITALPNGKLLIAGGLEAEGLRSARLFNPATDAVEEAAPMKYGRWYPHLAAGPDGNPTVFGGVTQLVADPQAATVRRTETYRADTNAWEENYAGPQSEATLPLKPRIVLAPNGQFFYAAAGEMGGPFGHAVDEAMTGFFQFFDPKTKAWSVSGVAPYGPRSGASVVPLTLEPPFDKMTLVTWGGVVGPTPGVPANKLTALTTIDGNGNVTNRNGADLNLARWHSSGVLLPDGRILAVGGADKDDALTPGLGSPVLTPELYDPATNEWTPVATHIRARGYHGSALLLPDMRVLLGGTDNDPSFEIWSPPYLFRGPRPAVVQVQRGVAHGQTFSVVTPDAALIESVVLLRTPSPEHANDSDQRALKLEFTRSADHTLTVTAPPSGRVAPPGPYYLVINKKSLQGPIPSVARMVEVGRADPADAVQPFPADPPAPSGGPAADPSPASPLPTPRRRWLFAAR